ncbi:hypothetical protein HanPSC8_Chr13g0592991 [Helianthus annuus]|nr:hypothetical protein HanPSC8_Chr13g0592991 [Helianthus annuus]
MCDHPTIAIIPLSPLSHGIAAILLVYPSVVEKIVEVVLPSQLNVLCLDQNTSILFFDKLYYS